MNDTAFAFLAEFLLARSGLALRREKEYLLNGRLIPVAQSIGLESLEDLVALLRTGGDLSLEDAVTEAMTTNETSFFRDKSPFDDFKNTLLPELITARRSLRRMRIWCAAASTGQEHYSVAMILKDHFPELYSWDVEILGTDLSPAVLKRAEDGVYTQFEVQRGLPIQLLVKHFESSDNGWRINDDLTAGVSFKPLNLLDGFSHLGLFDVVFCRNVLIYFDTETKCDILERMQRALAPDGYLILGGSETVMGITECLAKYGPCPSGVYVHPERQVELSSSSIRTPPC